MRAEPAFLSPCLRHRVPRGLTLILASVLAACAPLPQVVDAKRELVPVLVTVPAPVEPADAAARDFVAFYDRVRTLTPQEAAQEVARLGPGTTVASPQAAVELAVLLGQTRALGDANRAVGVLDAVLKTAGPAAEAWHPPARLLLARYTEQRRLEDQIERLSPQLRDSQRKVEQLNAQVEALKAIERSLSVHAPVRAAAPAPAPTGAAPGPAPRKP